jgi:hypothetical protein
LGTFLQSKDGSGHLAHGGQGRQGFNLGHAAACGQAGHIGGIILDFNIYLSAFAFVKPSINPSDEHASDIHDSYNFLHSLGYLAS